MFGIGMTELAIILVIALLVLGPTKLPQAAKSIGKGLRELRRASDDLRSAVMLDDDEPRSRYQPPTPPPARALPPPAEGEVGENGEVESSITGSVAAPSGTIARGVHLEDEHDPDDADDHGDMPYAPGSAELEELIKEAKARAVDVEASEPPADSAEKAEETA